MADNQSAKFASAELPATDAESSVTPPELLPANGSVGVGVAYFMKRHRDA